MDNIAEIWYRVERSLFPYLEECLPEMNEKHRDLVMVLETVRIEEYVQPSWCQRMGRTRKDRKSLARAFIAKAFYNATDTGAFIGRLRCDRVLRKICGWERAKDVPSESTFSRAFAEFARSGLGDVTHEAGVKKYLGKDTVWHVSRDSTEIDAREKPAAKAKKEPKPKLKRGRPRKGEQRPKPEPTRLERQLTQSIADAVSELPAICDVGAKLDSKGNRRYWIGYKLHVDTADRGIPVSALTTSASMHDSQEIGRAHV